MNNKDFMRGFVLGMAQRGLPIFINSGGDNIVLSVRAIDTISMHRRGFLRDLAQAEAKAGTQGVISDVIVLRNNLIGDGVEVEVI